MMTSRININCRNPWNSPALVEEEYYIYAGNQIVSDVDASGDLLRSYTYGPGIDPKRSADNFRMEIGQGPVHILSMTIHPQTPNSQPQTFFYLKDHQNTVIALTDSSGNVVESYDYDAYGNTKVFNASGVELEESAYGNRYLFQGREYDSATGLYYFRARWYNPETGRWLSKDPIGIAGGVNLYAFCINNPINYIDPSGLKRIAGSYATLPEASAAASKYHYERTKETGKESGGLVYSGKDKDGNVRYGFSAVDGTQTRTRPNADALGVLSKGGMIHEVQHSHPDIPGHDTETISDPEDYSIVESAESLNSSVGNKNDVVGVLVTPTSVVRYNDEGKTTVSKTPHNGFAK